jgi:hypothetical protein
VRFFLANPGRLQGVKNRVRRRVKTSELTVDEWGLAGDT